MESVSLIQLKDVTKKYEAITALDHLTLSIKDMEYVCVLGPTGAGKTTLLRIIAGLLDPDEGEIYIEGRRVNEVPPEKRNAVYMFQQYALFPHMNVWQNVSFSPVIKDYREKRIERLTQEILEMVKLADRSDAFPNELSGGMQQRIALARGLASGARILLLDEPLGALDARLRVDLRSLLRKLAKDQKLTIIHVTHDQEEALMIADRVVVIRNGKIEQIGTPQEIYTTPKSVFIMSFVGGANFIEGNVLTVRDSGSIIEIQGSYKVHVTDTSRMIGEKVVVALRLKDVVIGRSELPGANQFTGFITSVHFIGGSIEYLIRLDNGVSVSSKKLISNLAKTYKVNDSCHVSFLPDKCYVFDYPKTSLFKEIEAI
jgi:ABC-type Fe3+/spermidine/putrescine transport system ATPase subunit